MCYQKRLVYGACNHSAPLGMASACAAAARCEGARVHPLKTIRVEQMCAACRQKKVRADNNLATIAKKIRRLRGELAKRGFGKEEEGTGSGGGGRKEGSGSGSASNEGETATSGAAGGGVVGDADAVGRSVVPSVPSDEDGGLCSPPTPTPTQTAGTSVKRNDMFVGGVCLASTSLTSISGRRLL